MPDSLDVTIAKAIKTALQTASDADEFALTFDAERIYYPQANPEESRTLRVLVIQRDYTKEIRTRSEDENTILVDVVVCKPLGQLNPTSAAATDAIDAMRYFTEQLMVFLLRRNLGAAVGTITATAIGNGELMDDAAIKNAHVYLSPIQVTVTLND